jgi:hypothetical protein
MNEIRIAQIEARSWGSNPRNYKLNSIGLGDAPVEIDIIRPWENIEKKYHLFLISDDLCLTKLPFYIPKYQRVALLKESHLLPMIYEPLAVPKLLNRFTTIITHYDGFVALNNRFKLVPYSSNMLGACPYNSWTCLPDLAQKQKFCSAVISLGSDTFVSPSLFLRQQVIDYLSHCHSIDLFGRSSNPIEFKADALESYAFSIAMENTVSSSYFTEKLIDCILTGAIPIYHGSRSVLSFFDKRGILFFDSLAELKSILSSLSLDSYLSLREYAVQNFEAAIHLKLADYHGYLHRVLDAIIPAIRVKDLRPFRISTSLVSRFIAGARHGISFLDS